MKGSSLSQTKWYDGIHQTLNEVIKQASEGIFSATSALIHNSMTYTIIIVTIMVWLIMRLKNGYPTRDEMYSAGKWIMLVLFVYAIFYSYASYTGFISLFMLPANWVKSIISEAMGFKGQNMIDIINQASDTILKVCNDLYINKLREDDGKGPADTPITIFRIISMFWFWVYIAIVFIALFGGLLIITGSSFIATFLLTGAPIVIPFIVFKALRAYFFSWLKLFISYSLYAPIAFIIMTIILKPINTLKQESGNSQYIQNLYDHTFILSISYSLIVILGLYFMTKIPNWVSQIMGVQGLDAGGTGAAFSAMKAAGGTGAKIAGSGAAGSAGGMIGKGLSGAATGFAKGGIPGAIGGALKGGIGGAIGGGLKGTSAGIKNNVAGMKSASAIFKMAKNSRGATAKAG